ncbi:MAG: deoxyhypusine synthase family protein [Candidatus Methanomethyliaceae archaeon]|nr:deoxyhypusine synthase family protein [Candidatus Methanomethyliaceae archaeon]MDW7971082.1 deoxyhypusine synthase family protein [Nitrososphaerota archaeon]
MKYFKKKIEEIDLTPEKLKLREELLSNPVIQLDLEKIKTIRDLVEGWQHCGIQSRNLAECAMVYENMLLDEDRPIIFLGLAGALIAGGLRKVISDMICKGIVDVIVSTGAILYQDYYISQGYKHYKGSPNIDDELLRDLYIDRIYDAYIDEIGFVICDEKIAEFCSTLEPRKYSTREFLYLLGSTLKDEESILYNAYKFGVPIFCPAIADSSIGISLAGYFRWTKEKGIKPITIDVVKDNYEIAQIILKSKKTGAIYIGGGVPKNYINDAAVMLDYTEGHHYAFQITTEPPHWGGLSGSTLDEAKSWGKVRKKAIRATVYAEATIALPLIVGYILQKNLHKNRKRLKFIWSEGGDLEISEY